MIFKLSITAVSFLLVAQYGIAQDAASINATVDKNRIFIGEQVQLTVETRLPPGSGINFVAIDSIAHFELLERPVMDSSNKKGEIKTRAVYTITSFDSGHWVIPSFVLSPGIQTDSIPMDVIFSDFDPNQEYHDIKDILELKPSKNKIPWWWYAAGGVLLMALLTWYLRRRKPAVVSPVPVRTINPYDEAMKELEQLERNKPDAKQYHSRLTGIFRVYIFRKKGILSLQKTTDDLIVQLKKLDLEKLQFDKLAQSLRLSDFVKFAKYQPLGDDNADCFQEIKNAIVTIEKKEAKLLPPVGGRT